jgi:hypothetical protein
MYWSRACGLSRIINVHERWATKTDSCLVWRYLIFVIACWHLTLALVFLLFSWTKLLRWSQMSKILSRVAKPPMEGGHHIGVGPNLGSHAEGRLL